MVFEDSAKLELSLKGVSETVTFSAVPNVKLDVFIYEHDLKNHIIFHVNEGSQVNLYLISDKKESNFDIHGDVKNNGVFNIYFADLSSVNTSLNSNVILLGDNAKSEFKFSSIATKNIKKLYNVGFNHLGVKTSSNFEGYGVALNNGEIDLNSFQHKAYLKNECEAQGYDLTAIGDTSSAPLTLYSKKVDSLKALKELAGKKED